MGKPSFGHIGGFLALLSTHYLVDAQAVVGACKSQGCTDCPTSANAEAGFPDCKTYISAGNLDGFEDPDSINGYNVWWDSGQPNPNCRIIVRTPASTDLPECGLVLTSWEDAGCYFTKIQESFMLQYCCDDACAQAGTPPIRRRGLSSSASVATAKSIDEVNALQLQGIPALTSLSFGNMNSLSDAGSRSFGEGINMRWERDASSMTGLATKAKLDEKRDAGSNNATLARRDCTYTEERRFTKAGDQVRVSPTQNCNSAMCEITIESSITTGRTISASISAGFYGVVEASIGIEFTEEETRGLSTTFTQDSGTRGYVSFAPTFDCTGGFASGCGDDPPDGPVDEVCTPRIAGETNDGQLSFVFVQPGQD